MKRERERRWSTLSCRNSHTNLLLSPFWRYRLHTSLLVVFLFFLRFSFVEIWEFCFLKVWFQLSVSARSRGTATVRRNCYSKIRISIRDLLRPHKSIMKSTFSINHTEPQHTAFSLKEIKNPQRLKRQSPNVIHIKFWRVEISVVKGKTGVFFKMKMIHVTWFCS